MTKRIIKNAVAVILVLLLAYNSVYFKKLSDVKAGAARQFNPVSYARNYLDKRLVPTLNQAPDADMLLNQLKLNPVNAFKTYAHAIDIGNIRFFMVKGEGVITSLDENDVYVLTPGKQTCKIATEYVFGNALRDAPGLISVSNFTNTMDLNNISSEVNKIVRNEVLPPFKSQAKKGDKVVFAGAFEMNQEHINLSNIEIIPVSLKITN